MPRKLVVNPGDRFGSRVLVKEIDKKGLVRRRRWKWKCIRCGREGITLLENIIHKGCKYCIDRSHEINYKVGDRFGCRILLEKIDKEGKPSTKRWKWRCDYGREGRGNIYYIKNRKCINCIQKNKLKIYKPGDKIGYRVLIEEIDKEGSIKRRRWRWKCINCGNIGISRLRNIKEDKLCKECRITVNFLGKNITFKKICEIFDIARSTLRFYIKEKNIILEEAVFTLTLKRKIINVKKTKTKSSMEN